ncbi:MAG: hypothetical protein JO285_10445, partial [Kutzneria sp.]|nr:hypothetical protein [Kutzneria sp.]
MTTVVVAVVTIVASGGVAAASTAPAPPSAPQCGFADGEWARCLRATVTMPTAPAVGTTAHLGIDVAAQVDVAEARIDADLPSTLRWATVPAGFGTALLTSTSPETGSRVDRASRTVSLRKGETWHLDAAVAALSAGTGPLRVTVAGPEHGQADTATTSLVVTVGATAGTSHIGFPPAAVNAVTATPATTVVRRATPGLRAKSVGTAGLAHPNPPQDVPGARPRALTCLVGSWNYQDQAGATHPSTNVQVQLWAKGFPFDRMLSTGITDENGRYRLCSGSVSGSNVWIRFVAENGKWSVRDDDGPYQFDSPVTNDVGDGATVDLGGRQPADGNLM